MSDSSADLITTKLLSILGTSSLPLTTRDIGARLRLNHLRLPDHEIGALLRDLFKEGKVNYLRGRWTGVLSTGTILLQAPPTLPPLSKETLDMLDWKSHGIPGSVSSAGTSGIDTDPDTAHTPVSSSRWDTFRRLVAYYRQCICHEEGADASAFQNELGKRFLYLRRMGWWHPRPGTPWQTIVPLGPHLAPLINSLPSEIGDQTNALVIGYPIQAYYKKKEDEPGVAVIRPIFFFTVEAVVRQDGLIVSCEEPGPEVNLGWLEFAFVRNIDRQRSFLSSCGFLNRGRPLDEPPCLERGERVPGLENLVAALSTFMPEKVREPLDIKSVPDHPLHEPFSTGIYNRAVVMLAKRTKYTSTLLKELAAIERAPDEVLDRTALRYIFATDHEQDNGGELLHEAIVADISPLNAEQRLATASLLIKDVTVVTGPPGTGKTHLALSIGFRACQEGIKTIFTTAMNLINHLQASFSDNSFLRAMKRYTTPPLLIIDELGFLPIDKQGSDLLFQVISNRYECGSIIITTNLAFRDWGKIFNNDNVLASAIVDRLVHHSDLVKLEGDSYRVKNKKD